VAQDVGPEFKPSTIKKKREREKEIREGRWVFRLTKDNNLFKLKNMIY
jgi:hypothetical protein